MPPPEARRHNKPLFVFVQTNVTPAKKQPALIKEAQGWTSGRCTGGFATPDELRKAITRAVNRWQLSETSGIVDVPDMVKRATGPIPKTGHSGYSREVPTLWISVAGGQAWQMLHPSKIEKPELVETLDSLCGR
jgi:hypothetical protein